MNNYLELQEALEKGRKYELGHISTWASGQKAIKTQDGWVLLGGPNHGKLHGKTKGPVTHKELADNEMRDLESKPQEEKPKDKTQELRDKLEAMKQKNAESKKKLEETKARVESKKQQLAEIQGQKPKSSSNLIGKVDTSKTTKKLGAELNQRLEEADMILAEMGVELKTPVNFTTSSNLKSLKSCGGDYTPSTHTITIRSMEDAPKTLMHEIGHAIDYSMQDQATTKRGPQKSQGRSAEVDASDDKSELANKYEQLRDLVMNTKYYGSVKSDFPEKFAYVAEPTEVFARAFELYSYITAKKLVDQGKVSAEFLESFTPSVLSQKVDKTADINAYNQAFAEFEKYHHAGVKVIRDTIKEQMGEGNSVSDWAAIKLARKEAEKKFKKSDKYKALKKRQEDLYAVARNPWGSIDAEAEKKLSEELMPVMDFILRNDKMRKAYALDNILRKAGNLEPLEPTFYVGLVVMNKERTKMLVGCRKEDGLWTGPGGGAGLDESPKQAAVREAFEEANLKIKPYQLKELPTLTCRNGKMCHTFLVFIDRKDQKIHVGNDPDFEVDKWVWHNINKPLPGPTDENRLLTINAAKMKVMGLRKAEEDLEQALRKSIVEQPLAGVDLNTAEQSLDELASKDNHWIDIITMGVKDHGFGMNPAEVAMPDMRILIISKVDEGLYSAILKNDDPNSGNYGEVLTKFSKMTPESMVQGMKAKGFLPKDLPMDPEPAPSPTGGSFSELAEALKEYSGKELHVHLHKD